MVERVSFKFKDIGDLTKDELDKYLIKAQGKSRTRILTVQELQDHLKQMIESINYLVPKSYRTNIEVWYVEGWGESFAKAYVRKGAPLGTKVELFKKGSTYTVTLDRDYCDNSSSKDYKIAFPDNSKISEIKEHIVNLALEELGRKTDMQLKDIRN